MTRDNRHPGRKRIRLDRQLYQEPGSMIAATLATKLRPTVFNHRDIVQDCLHVLEHRSNAMDVEVIAYCFMPDHLHLLARIGGNGDLIEFVRDFKGRTSRVFWNHGVEGAIWQRSFYDHILREADDPMKHIRYILDNPVRAGLVSQWDQYPWSGSLVYDLSEPDFWAPGR